jgi:hypothetical protein
LFQNEETDVEKFRSIAISAASFSLLEYIFLLSFYFLSQNYRIPYLITGEGSKLKNISAEKDSTTLLVNIGSQSNGKLTIQPPENLTMDPKKHGTDTHISFVVIEDGQYYQTFDEPKNSNQVRQLTIYFDKGAERIGAVIYESMDLAQKDTLTENWIQNAIPILN